MKKAWLAGGGDFFEAGFKPNKDDLVFAVDAGFARLEEAGIHPNFVVGDFDSLGYIPKHEKTQIHPCIKDETDTMLAVKQALENGCEQIMIFGATGGRLAHTVANLQVLCYAAEKQAQAYIIDETTTITAAKGEKLKFSGDFSGYISVFPFGGEEVRVTLKGLKYELNSHIMPFDEPLGVSNEFTDKIAEITIESGTAIIMWQRHALPERSKQ